MENAVDALKIAFAVFIFIAALSLLFRLIGKIKETADFVLVTSDRETYANWEDISDKNGKIVDAATVISSLYNEGQGTSVKIKDESDNLIYPSSVNSKDEIIKNISGKYLENIVEITTGGTYVTADGEKISSGSSATASSKIIIYYEEI